MIFACSDDTVLEPSQPESCTNTTCRPDLTIYPTVYLDVNNDGNPDMKITHIGMSVCPTTPSDCSGYSWRVIEQIDSLYFAYDEMTERICAFSPGDTIDTKLLYAQGGSRASERLPIAEIYLEEKWDPFWSGVFVNPDICYLGFKLVDSGKDHFGWVGIRVSAYDATIFISTKCYQFTEGRAAIAGMCP
jgi:hypothetical protein